MSMNLHMDGVELPQTPTTVTLMCLSLDEEGKPDGGMEGVRRRFLIWLRGEVLGDFRGGTTYYSKRLWVGDVERAVNSVEHPNFWAM